ncbi:MAG: polymer-forming cytoskeletal protein [Patescibacteria group bacterium]
MENTVDTIIGVNVTLKGNLYNKGSIQVNGNIEGEVKSDENILVGTNASIKGPVIAKVIEVSGEIRGLVEASEKLEITPTGKIYGDINAKILIIKEGATFVGKSLMPANGADIKVPDHISEKPEEKTEPKDKENAADKMGFFTKK